jgi:hypothetical protein
MQVKDAMFALLHFFLSPKGQPDKAGWRKHCPSLGRTQAVFQQPASGDGVSVNNRIARGRKNYSVRSVRQAVVGGLIR